MSVPCKFHPSMPIALWPPSDQERWRIALKDDPFATGGVGLAARWRAATRKHVSVQYGVWLSWLAARGRLHEQDTPGARAPTTWLREYLPDMRWSGYADYTCFNRLAGLSSALRVLDPEFDNAKISTAVGRIERAAQRKRGMQIDPSELAKLLDFARTLLKAGTNEDFAPLTRALSFRDGLILALLIYRPLRVSNLSVIRIGEHLTGSESEYTLNFDACEMKSHRAYRCSVPPTLVRPLLRYLEDFRPLLAARAKGPDRSPALWLTQHGKALKVCSVSAVVRHRSEEALGHAIGPHRARHLAATLLAEELPEQRGGAALLLGHSDQETTARHYVHARAARAVERLEDAQHALRLHLMAA